MMSIADFAVALPVFEIAERQARACKLRWSRVFFLLCSSAVVATVWTVSSGALAGKTIPDQALQVGDVASLAFALTSRWFRFGGVALSSWCWSSSVFAHWSVRDVVDQVTRRVVILLGVVSAERRAFCVPLFVVGGISACWGFCLL